MRRALDPLLALCACALVEGLRVTEVEVPRVVLVGHSARVRCHFALEGEVLYSLKWWRDGQQFYQYIPRNRPKMAVFTIPGVTVNVARSGLHQVELVDLQTISSGLYRCEVVGEAPTFTTHVRAANMTVIDTPDGPPVVRGLDPTGYREGDMIRLNCTSYGSWPAPSLSWLVVRSPPHPSSGGSAPHYSTVRDMHLIKYPAISTRPTAHDPPSPTWAHLTTFSATLGLVLPARRDLAPQGFFKLRCRAAVEEHEWVTEVRVAVEAGLGEPHHLPALLNTGLPAPAAAGCAQTLDDRVLLRLLATLTLCLAARCLP
ncbi:uncharacterized protein [Panulirus ornatus]